MYPRTVSRILTAATTAALLFVPGGSAFADDQPITIKSDVTLVRVDAQVVDGSNRALTGLNAQDLDPGTHGDWGQISRINGGVE